MTVTVHDQVNLSVVAGRRGASFDYFIYNFISSDFQPGGLGLFLESQNKYDGLWDDKCVLKKMNGYVSIFFVIDILCELDTF